MKYFAFLERYELRLSVFWMYLSSFSEKNSIFSCRSNFGCIQIWHVESEAKLFLISLKLWKVWKLLEAPRRLVCVQNNFRWSNLWISFTYKNELISYAFKHSKPVYFIQVRIHVNDNKKLECQSTWLVKTNYFKWIKCHLSTKSLSGSASPPSTLSLNNWLAWSSLICSGESGTFVLTLKWCKWKWSA